VLTSHTRVTHVPCPIYCQDEDAIEDTDDMPILGLGRDDDSSDDDSSDDDITSNDEGSVELDTFDLYYDNEQIVNQTKEKQEHKMGKEKYDAHRTWTAVTYLFTLMLAGVACTTVGIQWGLGTMKNALVRVFF
jgi:hypothetical protein